MGVRRRRQRAAGRCTTYPYVCIDDEAAGRRSRRPPDLPRPPARIAMIAAVDPAQPGWRRDVETLPSRLPGTRRCPGRSPRPPDPAVRMPYTSACATQASPSTTISSVTVDWGGHCEGADAMAKLGLREPPTAVFAHSDEVALGAIRTIRRAGALWVPEDISVIGIDGHPLAELTDLSTVVSPYTSRGARRPDGPGLAAGRGRRTGHHPANAARHPQKHRPRPAALAPALVHSGIAGRLRRRHAVQPTPGRAGLHLLGERLRGTSRPGRGGHPVEPGLIRRAA